MLSYNPVKGDDSFLYNDLPQCGMYNEDGTVNYQITRLYLLQLIDYFKRFHDYLSNPQWQSQIDLSMCYECINCDNMVENIHSMRTDPQFKNNIYMPLIRQFMRLREACLQKLNNMKQRYPSPLNTPYQSPLTPYQSPLDYDDYNDDPEAYHFGQDYWSNTIYDDQYPSYISPLKSPSRKVSFPFPSGLPSLNLPLNTLPSLHLYSPIPSLIPLTYIPSYSFPSGHLYLPFPFIFPFIK